MERIEVRWMVSENELCDAAADVDRMLEHAGEEDMSPALCDLLHSLDDAITEAVSQRADASPEVSVRR
jgi:hypothetical protein